MFFIKIDTVVLSYLKKWMEKFTIPKDYEVINKFQFNVEYYKLVIYEYNKVRGKQDNIILKIGCKVCGRKNKFRNTIHRGELL